MKKTSIVSFNPLCLRSAPKNCQLAPNRPIPSFYPQEIVAKSKVLKETLRKWKFIICKDEFAGLV